MQVGLSSPRDVEGVVNAIKLGEDTNIEVIINVVLRVVNVFYR